MGRKILESYIRSLLQERGGWGSEVDRIISALGNEMNLRAISNIVRNKLELPVIGRGYFRVVFEIDQDWVLKVALSNDFNPRLANKIEADPRLQSALYPYSPKTIANGKYYGWIITERCTPDRGNFTSWLSSVGLSDAVIEESDNVRISSREHYLSMHCVMQAIVNDPDKFHDDANNDFVRKLMIADDEIGIDLHDIREENVGYGSDGRPVILDLGLSKDRTKHNLMNKTEITPKASG